MLRSVMATALILGAAMAARAQVLPREPTAAQIAAATVVPQFAAFLETLDPSTTASILRARDEMLARCANAQVRQKDAAFRLFNAFANKAWRQLSRNFYHSSPALLLAKTCLLGEKACHWIRLARAASPA